MKLFSKDNRNLFEVELPAGAEELRQEVRAFLIAEQAKGSFVPRVDSWLAGFSPEFSAKLGRQGWLGLTWPKQYGGHERSVLERFIVTEELLAAGAPVAAHWIADRQTGPLLLRYGTPEQCAEFLPRIARGECFFCIGMSEPNAGSDLASITTSAKKVEGGWRLQGRKIWTSMAHKAHHSIVLCRTTPMGQNHHEGMSQLIVDLNWPGITTRPIVSMDGLHHFNEVFFDEVFVPDSRLLGTEGRGWQQVLGELAFERSGPERILSTFPLLLELIREIGPEPDDRAAEAIGRLTAHLWTLRRMSLAVANLLHQGAQPEVEAALVKDLGTRFEREVIEVARTLVASSPDLDATDRFNVLLAQALLAIPAVTLRGGTTEILRGIVARKLVP